MAPPEPPSVDDRPLWDLWLSQFQLPVVLIADELDLFSWLDNKPANLNQICEKVALPTRSVEAMLAVLAALGYLTNRQGRFHLTQQARLYLLRESHFYWVPMLRDVGGGGTVAKALLERFRSENLSVEDRISQRWERGGITPDDAHRSNRNFHSHSFPAALGMVRALDFSRVRRVLDVAGGPGSFSIALALRYPEIRCTVADLTNVVPDTRTYIERYGCQDRVDTHAFNMFDDAWPGGYDAVFFSNVYHDWDPARRADLTRLAFKALPSGGRIFIHEMLFSDTFDGPLPAALFSILMLGTRGKQFSYAELEELLVTAGFTSVDVTETYGYYSVISATKP